MKMQINGFIFASKDVWDKKPNFTFFAFDNPTGWVKVCPHTIEFELPEEFSMEAAQIELLNKRKEAVTSEFQRTIALINEQISKFQCLEMTP